ncbi:Regulator of G-protein signaling rgs-3, partial [Toxocara canis]
RRSSLSSQNSVPLSSGHRSSSNINELSSEVESQHASSLHANHHTSSLTVNSDGRLKTPPPPNARKASPVLSINMAASMFDLDARADRVVPEMPSTDGIEYPRAASWASGTLQNVLSDDKGRQLFKVFLHDALAEENLSFIESYDEFKKMKDPVQKKHYVEEFFTKYSPFINISSVAMQKIKATASSEDPDPGAFALAAKEVMRLLENDQFPRFKRSEVYVNYLEKLLPRAYAEKWTTSFEALLGNQIGRHYFRLFLRNIHAEENLRFWEAVIEFRQTKNKSSAMLNMGRNIQRQYLVEGTHNEVFLPFGVRQFIEKKINDKDVDCTLFDEAIKHVEQVLKNDPYVRFLQSKEYISLLEKLH